MTAVRAQPDINSALSFHIIDAAGNPARLQLVSPTNLQPLPANATGGWLRIDSGNVAAPTYLSQANVTDLLAALTQFSRYGVIS